MTPTHSTIQYFIRIINSQQRVITSRGIGFYTISQFFLLVAAYFPLLLTLLIAMTNTVVWLVTTVAMLGLGDKRFWTCIDFLIHKVFTVCIQLNKFVNLSTRLLISLGIFSDGSEWLLLFRVIIHFSGSWNLENMWVLFLQLLKHFWAMLRLC